MERFEAILLSVWREACRHIEISESTATIARMLAQHLPVERLIVREIDVPRLCLETVATGPRERDAARESGRSSCSPAQMRRLLAWCRRNEVAHLGRGAANRDRLELLPERIQARAAARFESRHREMAGALLEPFSVALENDRRLQELKALREAAEADKRWLLSRLGRKELTDTIIGAEAGLKPVMERVRLVAKSDLPVLILGETGTGKEVIARAIHARSARASGPFIRVNCGAIPSELIDSQLFGHERGSFTGAVDRHQGWFERANGGTLFLDEIGELPLAAQVRLLRILQDGYLERVGGRDQIKVDIRIVAATHRDLTAMVREGRFREDLWYRIEAFPILLPPLRERAQDIPALAGHFAERAATHFGLAPQMPSPQDLAALLAYAWPGNVRELATVIDRAAILGDGKRLEVQKALGVWPSVAPRSPNADRPASPASPPAAAVVALAQAMKQHIEAALGASRGRIEGPFGAAAILSINPHTLRARMRKLGIDWREYRSRISPRPRS